MPVVNRFLILGDVHSSAPATTRTPERPPIVLAEEVRVRSSRRKGAYRLPRVDMLDNPPLDRYGADEVELERRARVLEKKLAGFGVQAQIFEIQPGPVVTQLAPGEGVKVGQIVNLADDLWR